MRTPHTVFQDRRLLESAPRLFVLWIAVAVAIINAGPSLVTSKGAATQSEVVLQTTEVPMLAGTFQQIGKKEGFQGEPSTAGNLVSYTDFDENTPQSWIRYFDFATNTDHLVPGRETDNFVSSSNVNGGRIAFHEVLGPGAFQTVMFDPVSQTRTLVLPGVGLPATGGNLIAFLKRESESDFEIHTYDLNTGVTTPLTTDNLNDIHHQVSPSGNAVVWSKCQNGSTPCDIYSAIQTSPAVFTTRALTTGERDDREPDTNGQTVAYIGRQTGETDFDVYFRPVEGGEETRLQIPLTQLEVKVAGNLIAFNSVSWASPVSLQFDIFVYDISTGNLSRVTNTPSDEFLGDFTINNGVGRIVYTAFSDVETGNAHADIFAFTFPVPNSAEEQINDLIHLIESFNLHPGTANGLITKLQNALTALDAGDTVTACDSLASFIQQCRAQSGKKLPADQANQLINSANQIKTDLGCQ